VYNYYLFETCLCVYIFIFSALDHNSLQGSACALEDHGLQKPPSSGLVDPQVQTPPSPGHTVDVTTEGEFTAISQTLLPMLDILCQL